MTVRRAVAIAIRSPDRPGQILLVRRPPDDDDLPDAWGLPAASLRPAESSQDAALRAARDKLGIHVAIHAELNRGSTPRRAFTLDMTLFDATLLDGQPAVPQPVPGVTQYADWTWGSADQLRPAARRGSLCCRLYLEHSSAP
jgi:8-oxo-dGTP diphosphatase